MYEVEQNGQPEAVQETEPLEWSEQLEQDDMPARKKVALKIRSFVLYLLFYGSIFVFASYIMPTYVCGSVTVDGNSMNNTLLDGDHLINEKVTYYFEAPKRYDIVIVVPFTTADKATAEDTYWVKRIIGLPGETIQIKGGRVYIDGELLDDDVYGSGDISYAGIAEDGYVIPAGEYFLMGDNRIGSRSYDSRYKEIGSFKQEQIVGKVVFRIMPKFGVID